MRGSIRSWAARVGHVTWLSGALLVTMATNDDGGCFGSLPDNGGEAECNVASDCEGQPHIMCVGSWSCDEGVCDWNCGATGCQGDADCPDGQRCRDDGTCVADPQPTGCYSSQDCKEGQHCNVEDGVCHAPPGCDAGEACPAVCYGECVDDGNNECRSDADCPTGFQCTCAPWAADGSGADAADRFVCPMVCLPVGECNWDGDCKEGQVCMDGVCQDRPADCYSNEECGPGFYCDFSQCWGTDPSFAPEDPDGNGAQPAPMCPGQCLPESGPTCDDGQVCPRGFHCEEMCTGYCPPCEAPDGANCDATCVAECKSECVPDQAGECQSDADCGEGEYCGGCGDMPVLPNGIAICYRQCLPKDPHPICHYDWECGPNQRCDLIACELPAEPDCDPANGSDCGARPVPPDSCWGYCVDNGNPGCRTDADCGDGYYCQIEWCTDSIPGECGGTCQPKDPPPGECQSDWDCIRADGVQGWCELYCETYDGNGDGVPECDPADASCGARPAPYCKGICHYEDPTWCDPAADTCPDGTHCESQCGGFLPTGLVACPWICVPDDTKCASNCDCGYGEQCVDGVCQAVETFACDDAWQCPEGYTCGCASGPGFGIACFPQCIPSRPQCCSDSDCGDGNQCVDGTCQPFYCWDGVCPDGYACESQCDFPTPANGLVMCPQVCVPKTGACQSDCDCPVYEACLGGECQVADRMNECYPTGCQDNSQCAAGQDCIIACPACIPGAYCPPCWGTCVDRPGCTDDADCAAGQHCEQQVECPDCVYADPPCLAPCVISDKGICVDDEVPPPGECRDDSQCAEGETCNLICPPCACPVDEEGNWGPCPWCECKGVCEPEIIIDPPPPTECYAGGCSGQVCSNNPDIITTCEWRDYYECFRLTTCDVQPDTNGCGWTPTEEFKACMAQYGVDASGAQ